MSIHPLAVVHPSAKIGHGVEIGPFCIIEPHVVIGDHCKLESRVVIKELTLLGDNNYVAEGAVLGGLPQHVDVPEMPGTVVIGSGNTIRENATIHRALKPGAATTIGNNNMLMVNTHVAHDCRMGNDVIMANNSMMAGHVTVGDRAVLSGAVAIHQFTRVGTLAMVGGQAHVTKDVPPFCTLDGYTSLVIGLNRIGLRRAGYSSEQIRELKSAYRVIYRNGLTWNEVLSTFKQRYADGPGSVMGQFLETTTRGILNERKVMPSTDFKSQEQQQDRDEDYDGPHLRVHAG